MFIPRASRSFHCAVPLFQALESPFPVLSATFQALEALFSSQCHFPSPRKPFFQFSVHLSLVLLLCLLDAGSQNASFLETRGGGLISILVYSTPASLVFSIRKKQRDAAHWQKPNTAVYKHLSKLLPQKLAVCVSVVGPKCSSQAWTYIYDISHQIPPLRGSKLKSVLAALPGSAGASTVSASFREIEK